jgi:hypothetical protein
MVNKFRNLVGNIFLILTATPLLIILVIFELAIRFLELISSFGDAVLEILGNWTFKIKGLK